jgi:hypothetical protein
MRTAARLLDMDLGEVVELVLSRRIATVSKPNGYPLIPLEEQDVAGGSAGVPRPARRPGRGRLGGQPLRRPRRGG